MKRILVLFVAVATFGLFVGCEADVQFFDPDSVTGTWRAEEVGATFGTQFYDVVISADASGTDQLKLYNFYNLNSDVIATYDDNFNITIATQQVSGRTISGSGKVSNNYDAIEWTFQVIEGSGASAETLTATYTKQSSSTVIPDNLLK